LIYIRHMIGRGELRVDLEKFATITQWTIASKVLEVKSFMEETHYLRNFIVNFSIVEAPLHAITEKGNKFH
jgi:hypothetical protein